MRLCDEDESFFCRLRHIVCRRRSWHSRSSRWEQCIWPGMLCSGRHILVAPLAQIINWLVSMFEGGPY